MMKILMGSFASYTDGFAPWRMPPCGVTLTVLDGVADANVFVTSCVTVAVAILEDEKWTTRRGYIVKDHRGG